MWTAHALLSLPLTATAPEPQTPPDPVSIPLRDGVGLAGWLRRPEARWP